MSITEYTVVREHELEDLITAVNSSITNGFQPFGSMVCKYAEYDRDTGELVMPSCHCQPMVKNSV
jgi:methenyltetrahydromethanopterin cyclohydrolase